MLLNPSGEMLQDVGELGLAPGQRLPGHRVPQLVQYGAQLVWTRP
jgi:hypothetical protein